MNKLIKTLIIFLISFWIWGIDWTQRNIDGETTKFLISNQYALGLRFFFLLFIIVYSSLNFKNNRYLYLFTSISGVIGLLFVVFSPSVEINTIINFLISSIIFIFLPKKDFEFLRKISFKTTISILLLGLIFLLIFDFSSLNNAQNIGLNADILNPNSFGLTTVYDKRFFGFFGGPIVLSSISGITFIYITNNKLFSNIFKFFTLVICFISISLSNSLSGLVLIVLYYLLSLAFFLLRKFSLKLPKFTIKNIFLTFLFLSSFIILYITQLNAINLLIGKISYILILISGNTSSASDLLNYDQFMRSSGTFLGRLLDINYVLSEMNLSSYLFGGLFDLDRNKILSESGLISLISIYGVPFTLLYLYITLKNFGMKIFILLVLFNIPYNIFLLHPVYLLAPTLLKKDSINSE